MLPRLISCVIIIIITLSVILIWCVFTVLCQLFNDQVAQQQLRPSFLSFFCPQWFYAAWTAVFTSGTWQPANAVFCTKFDRDIPVGVGMRYYEMNECKQMKRDWSNRDPKQIARKYLYLVTHVWPWPWPHDLGAHHRTKNEVCRSGCSVKIQSPNKTNRHTLTQWPSLTRWPK